MRSAIQSGLLFLFLYPYTTVWGQSATVQVRVISANERRPLIGASVRFLKTNVNTRTDENGETGLLSVKEGTYTLAVHHVGFLVFSKEITVREDTTVKVLLTEFVTNLDEVTVNAQTISAVDQPIAISSLSLSQKEIKAIPSIGGEHDIARTLALKPGVRLDNEGNAGLYVRGGSPDQNLLMIEQIPLYKYSHFFGFLSPLNSDIVRQIDLYKGGFPPRFGGRLSSVLDVSLRTATMQQIKVQGSIGVLSSRLLVELPIFKDRVSLLVAGRRSYFDIFTRFFNGSGTTSGPNYTFYDLNATLLAKVSQRTRLQVFAYQDRDRLTAGAVNALENFQYDQRWTSTVVGTKVSTQFNPHLSNTAEINLSNYALNQSIAQQQQTVSTTYFFTNKIRTNTVRNTIEWTPMDRYAARLGGTAVRYGLEPGNLTFAGQDQLVNHSLDTTTITEWSGFVENEFRFKRFWSSVGLRLVTFQLPDQRFFFPEPRLLLDYKLTPVSSIKASYARMNQALHWLTNPGFGIPTDLWFPATGTIRPQSSDQVSVAFSRDISLKETTSLAFSVEGYYKVMRNITAYRDGYSSASFTMLSQNNSRSWQDIITSGQGESYGLEFLLQKKAGRLSGWLGYTLSRTTNQFNELNDGQPFAARYDRRHDISIVTRYQLSKRWSVNSSWIYQTGQATTLPEAVYGQPSYDYLTNRFGSGTSNLYVYSARNSYRMLATHRLDLSLQCKTSHKWGVGELEISVYNAYNRKNPYYYYLAIGNQVRSVSLFSIIPSLSYSFNIYTGQK